MSNAHVIVIGAGPAGASTAILCRSFGLNVCLIEASPNRVSPGEALPFGVEEYFQQLGVAEALITDQRIRYDGLDFRWGDLSQNVVFDPLRRGFRLDGIQIPRDVLDKTLLARARELGVHVMLPAVVKGLFTRDGRIRGVVTNQGQFAADFVIDAAGSRHWMARKMRLAVEFFSPELFGYYGWAEGSCPLRDERPLVGSDETGWVFTSRIEENLYQFCRMSFTPLQLEASWLPFEFRDAGMRPVVPLVDGSRPRPAGRLRGADLTWRRVLHPAGPGFFLCGDSIARTDPIGQQGVFKSIVSGFQLAMALNSIYHGGVSEAEAREAYCDWIGKSYLRDLTSVRESYQQHPFAPAWVSDPASIQTRFLEPDPIVACA